VQTCVHSRLRLRCLREARDRGARRPLLRSAPFPFDRGRRALRLFPLSPAYVYVASFYAAPDSGTTDSVSERKFFRVWTNAPKPSAFETTGTPITDTVVWLTASAYIVNKTT